MTVAVEFEADLALGAEQIESLRVETPEEPAASEFTFPGFTDKAVPSAEPSQSFSPMGEEEKAYTANLDIRNVKVDRLVEPPEVSGEIKNQGTRTVESISVIVYCLDPEGQPMAEAQERVLDSRRGDSPLRPNYSKTFRFNLADIASDWGGQVKVDIDSMTLAE